MGGCATLRQTQAFRFLQRCDVELEAVAFRGVSLNGAASTSQDGKSAEPASELDVLFLLEQFLSGNRGGAVGQVEVELQLRVENRNPEGVWVNRFDGTVSLDDLISNPVRLADKVLLRPGVSTVILETSVPLDDRLFKLASVRNYRLQGVAIGVFPDRNQRVEWEFDQQRPVSEKIRERLKSAKKLLTELLF